MAWETSPCSYTSPQNLLWIFETLWVIIFWVRVTHKMLNVNWEKIHSIILSVTCHGFRNFPQLIHIPSYPFMNFQNPVSYYCLPRERHSEAAHEKRLLCAQKCTRGGVGWVMQGWGGVRHVGVGWGGKKMQPQNKGPGMLWGRSYVMPMTSRDIMWHHQHDTGGGGVCHTGGGMSWKVTSLKYLTNTSVLLSPSVTFQLKLKVYVFLPIFQSIWSLEKWL